MDWTKEQKQVITLRNRNLLVSAAAGSGKTAVLVERIIGRILDSKHPADIDRILVVTFTSSAAAEMRERIGAAIEAALQKDPQNSHLMKQTTLVHHAQITTIHSFCLNLIKNYFHRVDLEPNFRIAEEGELNLLREDVMAEVLNRNYEAAGEKFLAFVECFATGKKDDGIKDMILKAYHFSMSYPWPKEWLQGSLANYHFDGFEELDEMPWMKALMAYLGKVAQNLLELARKNICLTGEPDGPGYLSEVAERDALATERLAGAKDYRSMSNEVFSFQLERLPSKRGFDGDEAKLDCLKEQRAQIKDTVKKIKEDFFFADGQEMLSRLGKMTPVMEELVRVTEEFMDDYAAKKREKNILDFDDLEHFALRILIQEDTKTTTEIAAQCRELYEEVMVDEYQDSNLVQESLLQAVSGEENGNYNRFMVGDVKQSIYRFRLARPELFMEKYDAYTSEESSCQKIELHQNFRSRREVIDTANHLFGQLMKKDLGNVEYDEAAALYPGAVYPECCDMQTECIVADSGDALLKEAGIQDPVRLEAEIVAARIRKLMRGQKVTDPKTKQLRQARYSDIVILLRSSLAYADTFLEVLEQRQIPAHVSSKTGYFKADEVQTVLSFLRILDNPRQDIPLASVLRSAIGTFTDEELAALKAAGEGKPFHRCVLEPEETGAKKEILEKQCRFLEILSAYRDLVPELSVHELLYRILEDTGYARYVAAMPGGERRRANLEMLLEKAAAYEKTSYRGLFHFIRYMDKLQKYEVDYGEAEIVHENADAVRIMTIHKSKGLEFPIVFLCQTAKQFNRMDARSSMVIHSDFGIGLGFIDPVRRIRGATLIKKAIAVQTELENLGEELRVLYVALTRAKEKLILTGVEKQIKERLEQFEAQADRTGGLSFLRRRKACSYLDWILPAMYESGDQKLIQIWGADELLEEETLCQLEEEGYLSELARRIPLPDDEADAYVDEQLSYVYPEHAETNRRTKYSVSELKHRAMESLLEEEEFSQRTFPEEEIIPYRPRFAGGDAEEYPGVLRGSAMHRAIECLPVEVLAGNQHLHEQLSQALSQMVEQGRLTEEMRRLIRIEKLMHFYQSDLAMRMKRASLQRELYVEQPFVMGKPADEIEGDGSGTMVLVQGIIDAYFIEDGEIVLLDYKTDRVAGEEELILRYQKQLELYQQALEKNLGRKVKETLIYSFWLDKTINV